MGLTIHADCFFAIQFLSFWELQDTALRFANEVFFVCTFVTTHFTSTDPGHRLSCFNDPNTCSVTDLRGYVEELLLASRKPKFYCAVTLGLLLLGIFSVWLGLLYFVAQMLGTVLGAAILTLLYSEKNCFTHDLGSNRGWDGAMGTLWWESSF